MVSAGSANNPRENSQKSAGECPITADAIGGFINTDPAAPRHAVASGAAANASILAAQTKSFSDNPPMACVL